MAWRTITQNEIDDAIVQTYKANEMDLAIHQLNKQRFETMLQTLAESTWRERVKNLLAETNARITEVQSILDATTPQLPIPSAIDASLARLADSVWR